MALIQTLEATPAAATMQVGSSGAAVQILQQNLKAWGFDPIEIDGIFGEHTKSAVIALQRKLGLTADGIYGPGTAAAVQSDLASSQSVLKTFAASAGLPITSTALAVRPLTPASGGALPAVTSVGPVLPFYKQSWFIPTALGVGAAILLLAMKNKKGAVAGTDFDDLDSQLEALEQSAPPKKRKSKGGKASKPRAKRAGSKAKKAAAAPTGGSSTEAAAP